MWQDNTNGIWGPDVEIMYAKYSIATGWSNATVISDGTNNIYWNNGGSYDSEIVIDRNNVIHVVWEDHTAGIWGGTSVDVEIMYVKYTTATGWSTPKVISDGYGGVYWNDLDSENAAIAAGIMEVHIVWEEETNGVWGTDTEIFYTNFVWDDLAPIINIIAPNVSAVIGTDAPSYVLEITEPNLNTIWYSLNGRANNSVTSLSGTIDQAAWAALPEGNVTLRFYADDLVGNMAYAEISMTKSSPSSGGIPGYDILILGFMIIGISIIYTRIKWKKTHISKRQTHKL